MSGSEQTGWDEYVDEHDITEQEAPQAFAAFLHEATDGRWDGAVIRASEEDPPSVPPV